MRKQAVKYELNQQRFETGKEYRFTNEDGIDFNLKFTAYSRIDGYPLFDLDFTKIPVGTVLANATHQGFKPKSTQLITALEDHISMYRSDDFIRNRDTMMDFFFDMYDIDLEKLAERDGLKEIMRDIKLINVLN